MYEIEQLDPQRLAGIKGLFTDIDDTLSTNGKITAEAYAALWLLHESGMHVVVVTGRPGGVV